MSDHQNRNALGRLAQWLSHVTHLRPGTGATTRNDAIFVPRETGRPLGAPFGDPDLFTLAQTVAGELDTAQRALLSCYVALRKAYCWPFGPSRFDTLGRRSMCSVTHLLAVHHLTLNIDIDLGSELYGMLVYPARTVFMNARFFRGWQDDEMTHGALRAATLMMFAVYLIQPVYVDVLSLPFGFEHNAGGPLLTSLWRTASWMALEMLLPAPMLNRTMRNFATEHYDERTIPRRPDTPFSKSIGHLVDASVEAHMAAEIAGCSAPLAQLKLDQLAAGVASAFDNPAYGHDARSNPLWPYATHEVADALATYDWSGVHTISGHYLKARQHMLAASEMRPPAIAISVPARHAPTSGSRRSMLPLRPTPEIFRDGEREYENTNGPFSSGPLGPPPFRI